VHTLEALQRELPALSAVAADVTHGDPLPTVPGGFDAVLCVDGLDKADDDAALLERMRDVLAPDGRVVLLLSHGPWNFGSLDRGTGRQRRYTRATVEALANAAGMVVRQILPFNRVSSIPWWIGGRLLHRGGIDGLPLKALDVCAPVLRRVDGLMPLPSLSLIAILTRPPYKASFASCHEAGAR
jgi:SAM-dependent methyltransferase